MDESNFGQKLKAWRRANGIKQETIASALDVSQAAISRWENGIDVPSVAMLHRVQKLVSREVRDELAIDRQFLKRLSSVEAIFDLDGIRLKAASEGMSRLWPEFSRLIGRPFEPRMSDESRIVLDDTELRKAIVKGDVAIVAGVSVRHLDLNVDNGIKHRWLSRFRLHGHRVLTTMVYEPCKQETPCGIEEILRLDDFTAA